MNTEALIAVLTAAGTTIGALTALIIAVNKLFNSVPSHLVKPVETIGKPNPVIPANPNMLP